jgi:hypothetical protein
VLVGHSYGGYIARLLEHAINSDNFLTSFTNVKVKGVLTIATPHQGIGVAGVSYGPNNEGLRDISNYVNEFRDALVKPYNNDQSGIIGSWISTVTLIFNGVDAMTEIEDLFNLFDDQIAFLEEKQFIGYDLTIGGANLGRINFNEVIGYNGVFPKLLNSIETTARFRSIYGVEKTPIPVRISDEIIGNGNEKAAADNFSAFDRYYQAEEDWWRAIHDSFNYSWILDPFCIGKCLKDRNRKKDEAKRKENNWKAGRQSISNIDDTWGEIIDSYFTETKYVQVQEYVGVCNDGESGPNLSIYSNLLSPIDECTETGFRTVNKEVTVVVAQKNDAVFAPQYGVWKETSMPYYETGRVSGNYYYSDTEEKGGYNHMELRRYKRAYDDPGNGIVKGDKARPMDQAEQWIRDRVLSGN